MRPAEVAELYLKQIRRPDGEWPERPEGEPSAITIWEDLICRDDPELAWPVFREILIRRSDDETVYQVGARIRLLLWRYYDQFIGRVRELFREFPRLWRIMGDDALDRSTYVEEPYDRQKLIETYERYQGVSQSAHRVGSIMKTSAQRGLVVAIEIIHRAPKHGLSTSDVFDPLRDLLLEGGEEVIEAVERAAHESVLVRRALWNALRSWRKLPAHVAARCRVAAGTTTDYTDDFAAWPLPRKLEPYEEMLVESWFESEKTFWAWTDVADMVDSDPDEAWEITRRLLERSPDHGDLFTLAAGPLEDLLHKQPQKFDEIAAAARQNANVREALGGVWIFPDDAVFDRFNALLKELGVDKGLV